MSLENDYIEGKQVDWISYLILSKFKEHDCRRKEEEKKNFNPNAAASIATIASAFLSYAAILYKDHPEYLSLAVEFFILFLVFFFIIRWLLKLVFTIYYRIKSSLGYTPTDDELKRKNLTEEFNNNTVNQIYLVSSIIHEIHVADNRSFVALQLFDAISIFNRITDTIKDITLIKKILIKEERFSEGKYNVAIEVCKELLSRIESSVEKNSAHAETLNKEISILRDVWMRMK